MYNILIIKKQTGGIGYACKSIMMPFSKLACISVENTVEEAMKIIDEQGLLSLPVVDGQQFVGVLSKQFLFEEFFRNYTGTREEFAQPKSDGVHEDKN